MSLRHVAAATALLLLAGRAEAGIFGGKDSLPKPISLITDRVERNTFVGLQARHPPKKYSDPKWGARWDLSFKNADHPPRPSLRVH